VKKVLFRVDGSNRLGLGHIMRCLAFAEGFRKEGLASLFLIKDYDSIVAKIVKENGFEINTMPPGFDFLMDASITVERASNPDIKLMVFDLSHADNMAVPDMYERYLKDLLGANKFTIALDDFSKIDLPFDIRIVPYYGAENVGYKSERCPRSLLGPAYFIFRKEFIEAAKLKRQIKRKAENVFITTGGSDPFGLTIKYLKALTKLEELSLNLKVFIGTAFSSELKQDIEQISKDFKGNIELRNGNMFVESMLWSDLVLTAGGLTKYETAVTGTPSIAIATFQRESEMSKKFAKGGTNLYLGLATTVDEDIIAKTVRNVLSDHTLRTKMSAQGKTMVDGLGIERIISNIPHGILNNSGRRGNKNEMD
jgi:UDP-2,4-diacetamido-2,4,6-trideoxy-beta-L-altropyranose hydrolase